MLSPISVIVWQFSRGTAGRKSIYCKKLTSLLLAFLFFLQPLAFVRADDTTTPSVTIGNTVVPDTSAEKSDNPQEPSSAITDKDDNTNPAPQEPALPSTDINTDVIQPGNPAAPDQPIVNADLPDQQNTKTNSNPSPMTSEEGAPYLLTGGENQNKKSLVPNIDPSSGALSYSYGFSEPPGRNNFEPNLALEYNSQDLDRSSIAGLGWSFNIPYIIRVNKTGVDNIYSTNYFSSSIDGELATTTTATKFIARTDKGSFNIYTFSSNQWLMTDKNGTQYEFGYSSSTQQSDPNNGDHISKWMLEKMTDANNNTVTYSYYKNSGQIYPTNINYTGNGSNSGIFDLSFSRAAVTYTATSSALGYDVITNYNISELDAKINGTTVRKYALSYASDSNGCNILLNSITETGYDSQQDQTVLPATSFTYQNISHNPVNQNQNSNSWASPVPFNYGVDIVDVNGDGLEDIVQAYESLNPTTDHIATYLNLGNGWAASSTWNLPVILGTSNPTTQFDDNGVRFADVNGDGLTDILISNLSQNLVYLNNGNGWSVSGLSVPALFSSNNSYDNGSRIADINGDGLPDIIDQDGLVYLDTGSGWASSSTWTMPANFSTKYGGLIADLNGDGLSDLIRGYNYYNSTVIRIAYLNNGHGWTQDNNFAPPIDFVANQADSGYRLVDGNGDGLPDIFYGGGGHDSYLNTGHGWSNTSENYPYKFYGENSSTYPITRVADFNGDGIADEMVADNQGTLFTEQNSFNYQKADVLSKVAYPQGGFAEITYWGSSEYLVGGNLANQHLPLSIYTVEKISIDDGNGLKYSHSYTYENGAYYYGLVTDKKFAGFGKITDTNAAGNSTYTYYHNSSGTDASHGEYQDNFYKIGQPYRIEQRDSSGNLYKKTVNKWDSLNTQGYAGFVQLTQSLVQEYNGGTNHKDSAESFAYDASTGNQTQKIQWGEVTGSDDGTFTDAAADKVTTNISYASSSGSSVFKSPYDITVADQSDNKVKESRYYYDGLSLGSIGSGNQTKKEDWVLGTSYVNSQKAYNTTYGLVTQSTDADGSATNYSYDSYYLYPAIVTNPLNQDISYTYDYSIGKPNQVTDPNSAIFQTIYDGLGRIVQEKIPDPGYSGQASGASTVLKTQNIYTDEANNSSIRQQKYLNSGIFADSYSYLDGLGRTIQTRTKTKDQTSCYNCYAVKDTVYNNTGQVSHQSLPYFGSNGSKTASTSVASLYINYTYDALGRTLQTSNAVGTTTNSYSTSWAVTVTDPMGKYKDYVHDAFGRLTQVKEHNQSSTHTTSYTYDPAGDLTEITDAAGNIRNFSYDGLGRRLSAEDLHASGDPTFGLYSFSYDNNGNLTQKNTPNSDSIIYAYDVLNRLATETLASIVKASYTYDNCTNGIGRLCSGSKGTNNSASYTYNGVGNILQETKTIDSQNFVTGYAYDRQGNVLTQTNPDNSQVQYSYASSGQLSRIKRKESTDSAFTDLVSYINYSPTGQQANILYGKGVATINIYDATKLYRLINKVTTAPSEYQSSMRSSKTLAGVLQNSALEQSTANNSVTAKSFEISNTNPVTEASSTASSTLPSLSQAFNKVSTSTAGNIATSTAATTTSLFMGNQRADLSFGNFFHLLTSGVAKITSFILGQFIINTTYAASELYQTPYYNDSSLVSYYRLESDGSDNKGSNNLANYGDTTFTAAKFNNGANFPSGNSTEYLQRSDNLGLSTGADRTISVWVKVNTEPANNGNWQQFVHFNYGSPSYRSYAISYLQSSGVYYLFLGTARDYVANDGIFYQIDLGTTGWHHLVITNSGTSGQAYVDGQNVGSWTISSGVGQIVNYNTFTVGALQNPGVQWYANALVDDVAVFSRALSSTEISDLYNTTYGGSVLSLTGLSCTTNPTDTQTPINCNLMATGISTSTIQLALFGTGCNMNNGCPIPSDDIDQNTLSATNTDFSTLMQYAGTFTLKGRNSDTDAWVAVPETITVYSVGSYLQSELYQTSLFNDSGLDSYYRFESNSNDSKGSNNGNDTSITYGTSYGKFGQGANFGSSSKIIKSTGVTGLPTGNPDYSVNAWVYFNSLPNAYWSIIGWGTESYAQGGGMGVDANHLYMSSYANDAGPSWTASTGQWYMLTVTYDHTANTITGYVNGTSIGTASFGGTPNITLNGSGLWIGIQRPGCQVHFLGNLDDVSIFGRTLTSTEVSGLYNGMQPVSGNAIQDLSYTYDANGNITEIVDASATDSAKTVTYSYDDLNRLTNASSTGAVSGGNYNYTYSYDALGNVLSRTENSTTTNYAYATSTAAYLNPDARASVGNKNYTYDNNGNLTSIAVGTSTPVSSYTWDYNNRMTQSVGNNATTTYAYDYTGQRVKMTVATTSSATTYYPSKYYNITGSTPTKNIFLPDGTLIATVVGTGATTTVSYIHPDHLGGMNVSTDESGAVNQILDFYPYGTKRLDEQTGFNSQRQFANYEYDSSTNLNYLNQRYYDPTTAGFISQDPVFLDMGTDLRQYNKEMIELLSDPQELNSYSYARNNPIINVDPTGEASKSAWFFAPIQTAAQVAFWKSGAAYIGNVGINGTKMPIAAELLNRSLSLNPTGITATENNEFSNITTAVKNSSDYNQYINDRVAEAENAGQTSINTTRYDDNSVQFKSGDLYYAIKGTKSIAVMGNKTENGQWNLDVKIHDIYDFQPSNYDKNKFGSTANNTALLSQYAGAISKYDVDIKFQDKR